MNPVQSSEEPLCPKPHSVLYRCLAAGIKIIVSAAIIAAAVCVYRYQIRTSPQAHRKKPPTRAKLVEVIPVTREDCATIVTAMGTITPAQEVTLHTQVSGQIIKLSSQLIPGAIVNAEQMLIAIDPRDYEIAVQQRKNDLVKATEYLKIEQGNQVIAKQEYELLGEVVAEQDRELMLRRPQLESALSAVESAASALLKAQLDLSRCEISAPFNAIIRRKHVDIGAAVTANTTLVTLTGTDQAWIEVMVRTDQLKWLDIPERNGDSGSEVTIRYDKVWGPDKYRKGKVLRLGAELETQALWARLLAAVEDPFCLKPENQNLPQLLMGTYVRTDIQGRALKNVCPVNRSYLRDNDTVWIMDNDNKLEIRKVQIAFRQSDRVFIDQGLTDKELLVVTDLAAPVAGMPLRTGDTQEQKTQEDAQTPAKEGAAP